MSTRTMTVAEMACYIALASQTKPDGRKDYIILHHIRTDKRSPKNMMTTGNQPASAYIQLSDPRTSALYLRNLEENDCHLL